MNRSGLREKEALLELVITDAGSGKRPNEEWALKELKDFLSDPKIQGTPLAHRAQATLNSLMEKPLMAGVLINGKPLTRMNMPGALRPKPLSDFHHVPVYSGQGQRICVSSRRYQKRHFPGPRPHRKTCLTA